MDGKTDVEVEIVIQIVCWKSKYNQFDFFQKNRSTKRDSTKTARLSVQQHAITIIDIFACR